MHCSGVSIVDIEQVITGLERAEINTMLILLPIFVTHIKAKCVFGYLE